MNKKLIFILVAVIFITGSVCAQEGSSKKEQRKEKKLAELNETKQLIESMEFRFEADKAYPKGGQTIDLTTNPNFLVITDSVAHVQMPFFGEAYRADYGSSKGGIEFNGKMKEFKIETIEKKLHHEIRFKVDGEKDNFECYLTISYDKYASLTITSHNKSQISYRGIIKEIKKDED